MSDTLAAILKRYWGYESFRPLQERAMRAVASGRDSLVVMPTGGGKSLSSPMINCRKSPTRNCRFLS